jgi:molybdate transport system substrate-binding protein
MWKRLSVASVTLILLAGVAACGDDDSGGVDGQIGGTVLVFAAASLTDAFAEIATAFEAEYPGVDVQLNLAGSSSLREQILEGAPADVFASANQSNMDQLIEAGEVDGDARVFAENLLQIAVPAQNPAGVAGLEDFARQDLLIGLCAEGVPCGDFAREALANAGVEASIDTNEPDVRALLTKIGADELDAGIVYVTDIIAAGDLVEGIDIADDVNVVASYPIAPLAEAPNAAAASAFVDFVLSEQGQSILVSYGFAAP